MRKMWMQGWLVNSVAFLVMLNTAIATAQDTSNEKKVQVRTKSKAKSDGSISAEIEDGMLVIKLANGETRTIDLGDIKGKQNIVIDSKLKKADGETTGSRRIFFSGPDGNQEIFFKRLDDISSFADTVSGVEGVFDESLKTLQSSAGKFVIGVHCRPIDESLKSHLNLKGGLLVESVVKDSSAEKSGVQKFDILINAGDKKMSSIENLTAAIQVAGDKDQPVELIVIRNGKEQKIDLKPTVRQSFSFTVDSDFADSDQENENEQEAETRMLDLTGKVRFNRILPGLIRESSDQPLVRNVEVVGLRTISQELAELRKEIEQLRKEIRNK